MTRVILILLTVFMILTILKNLLRNYRYNSSVSKKNYPDPKINNDKKHNNDKDIIDAKFEEIK
ncbi:MAG TPA: hypothetical protein PKC91_14515 [Ignavibacteria bacterium]|nr:hypothetical protein [Ignavibacteria bacterium]